LFIGILNEQLRFFTLEGDLVPTPEEAEAISNKIAETERQRAETERQRGDRLRQKLQELGIDPAIENMLLLTLD
jgi:cysteinyl-tRNA synthetase